MPSQTLTIATTDGPMDLFEARPDGDAPTTAIVLVQEAFGVNSHIEDVGERLAALGHLVVAPHFFHRAGGGTVPYGQFDKVMEKYAGLDDAGILVDVDAALGHLAAVGIDAAHTGLVGFCFGGRVSFLVAAERAIGASIGFYGGGIVTARFPQFPALVDRVPTLKTPWLGLFGDDDGSIPVDQVEHLRAALVDAPVEAEVVRYAGAGHGFFRDVGDDYRPDAAADAWSRLQGWYARYLAS